MCFSFPVTINTVITENQDFKENEDIPIAVDESFTKELDSLTFTSSSLKTSTSSGSLEMNFRKVLQPRDKERSNLAFSRSKSTSAVVSNHLNETSTENSISTSNSSCTTTESKKESGVAKAFYKVLTSAKPKPTVIRHMDTDNPYMRHTLKRKSKKVTKTSNTPTNDDITVLNDKTSKFNDDKQIGESGDEKKPGRQSWGTEMPDFSYLPGTIWQFSEVH